MNTKKGYPIPIFAKTPNGEEIELDEKIDRSGSYYCIFPDCNAKLIYCCGEFRGPYFRHPSNCDCVNKSEAECMAHIGMKFALQQLLQIPKCDFEHMISEIPDARPDLIWRINDKVFAIEVQHSLMTPQKWFDKTRQYLNHNVFPLWILHENESNPSEMNSNSVKNTDQFKLHNNPKSKNQILQIGHYGKQNAKTEEYSFQMVEILIWELYDGLFYLGFFASQMIEWDKTIRNRLDHLRNRCKIFPDSGPRLRFTTFNREEDLKTRFQEQNSQHIVTSKNLEEIISNWTIDSLKTQLEKIRIQYQKEWNQQDQQKIETGILNDLNRHEICEFKTIKNKDKLVQKIIFQKILKKDSFLPENIFVHFYALTEIELVGLKLTHIPRWIFNIPNLISLDMRKNEIEELPDFLDAMSEREPLYLEQILLSHNKIQIISDTKFEKIKFDIPREWMAKADELERQKQARQAKIQQEKQKQDHLRWLAQEQEYQRRNPPPTKIQYYNKHQCIMPHENFKCKSSDGPHRCKLYSVKALQSLHYAEDGTVSESYECKSFFNNYWENRTFFY